MSVGLHASRLLVIAACAIAGALAAEPTDATAKAPPDFFWKLSFDAQTNAAAKDQREIELLPAGAGSRALVVRIGARRATLLGAGADGAEREIAAAEIVAFPKTAMLSGRGGVCALTLDGAPVLRARTPAGFPGLADRPAFRATRGAVRVTDLRRVRPEPLIFEDGFSRPAGEAGPWGRRRGNWESAAHFFAERSANAGALRARFAEAAPEDPLTAGRTESRRSGLGVVIAPCGSALCVERIAGGSPAERAGLAEGDILIGSSSAKFDLRRALLFMGLTGQGLPSEPIELSVLRPGERELRHVRVTPEAFVWGRSREAIGLPGAAPAAAAMALVGEDFWRPARIEVSARTHGPAGFGLAFSGGDDGSALVFRLRPASDGGGWLAELFRVGADGTDLGEPLERAAAGAPWPDSWYRLAVEISEDGLAAAPVARCLLGDREMLRARLPSGGFGPIGLWAGGADGWAEFDDFAAGDDPAELARRALRPAGLSRLFASDEDMGSWADAACDWKLPERPDGAAVWRFPALSGAEVRIESRPAIGSAPIEVAWWCDGAGEGGGAAEGGAKSPARPAAGTLMARVQASGLVELFDGGKPVASGELPSSGPYFVRMADGALSVSAASGGRPVANARTEGAAREVIAVRPASAVLAGGIGVRPAGGMDLGFDRAPSELVAVSGTWGLTTKWVCDPRWSWYGGRGSPLAAVWTSRAAGGDQQLDAFAALMMQRLEPPFERAHDFGLALCGDGRSVWSGYTLVFGAEGNRCTRLYRRGVLVAESRDESARFPADTFAMPERHLLHQRWFRLTLARRGSRLTFLLDGRERLSWTDPEPLEAGRAAAWTFDNGMMLGRLRLDAARLGPAEPDLGAPSAPRPAAGFDLPVEFGAPPKVTRTEADLTRVEAVSGGGPLAIRAVGLAANPIATSGLNLRLRAPAGSAVDLYLDGPEGRFRVGLLGPPPAPDAPERETGWLGAVRPTAGRGEEREFDVPIGALWRDYWWRRDPRKVHAPAAYRVLLGCFAEAGKPAMGLGANSPGAWYEASEIRAVDCRGDREPPRVGELRYEPGGADSRSRLVVALDDPGGSGLDRTKLALRLDGAPLNLGIPGVDYSERSGELSLDLAALGVAAPGPEADGQPGVFRLGLSGIADHAGNRLADRELAASTEVPDRRAPETIRVSAIIGKLKIPLDVGPERFRSLDTSNRSVFERRLPTGPGEPEGCEVVSLMDGGPFGMAAAPAGGKLDLLRVPEVDLSYRVDVCTPLLFGAFGTGFEAIVPINDRFLPPNAFMTLNGKNPGSRPVALFVRADGRWHRTGLPLADICRQNDAPSAPRQVGTLRFGDLRFNGNRAGMSFEIAGLRLVPAARPEELAFSWSAWDAGGVAACRSAFDQSPETVPTEPLLESGRPLPDNLRAGLKDGAAWLHLAFSDRAGNWGSPAHYRVLLDSQPPAVAVRASGHGLEFELSDPSGVDPASLRLEVAGKACSAGKSSALAFDEASGRLAWNARATLGRPLSVGENVEFRLTAVDGAGNATEPPISGTVKVDFAADREAPTAPRVRIEAGRGATAESFERSMGEAGAISRSAVVERGEGDSAAWGRSWLRLSKLASPVPFRARLRSRLWPADVVPVLAFDCRAHPGARLELAAQISGHEVTVPLAGPGGRVAADGSWHRVQVDLAELLSERVGKLPALVGRDIEVREPPGADSPAGVLLEIDNLELRRAAPGDARLAIQLESSDAVSGVAGFAVLVDRRSDSTPEQKADVQAASADGRATFQPPAGLEPGQWWVHAAAVDFAGNRGAVTHYGFEVARKQPAQEPGNPGEAKEATGRPHARITEGHRK